MTSPLLRITIRKFFPIKSKENIMKVAFWSGFGMDTKKTLHIATISIVLTLVYHKEVVLSSNYISSHMLSDCFFGVISQYRRIKGSYRYCYGEPNYFRSLWDIYKKEIISTPMEGITIIRPPDVIDKSMFYYEVSEQTIFFMDVASESNLVFGSILEEADLVIIFLPQDSIKIQIFFEHYSSLIPKSLFIIDNFRKNGSCIPKNLSRKYRIDKESIGIFPYCYAYEQACEAGNMESFLKKNLNCSTRNPNFYFMYHLQKTTKMLTERM